MADEETDTLGLVSCVIAVLTWLTCFGSCIPYLNIIFIFPSMLFSLLGTILGGVGIRMSTMKGTSPGLSIAGMVLNGVPLLMWVLYWLFTFLMVFGMLALMFVAVAIDIMS